MLISARFAWMKKVIFVFLSQAAFASGEAGEEAVDAPHELA
jgi:hypothetical protein